MTADLADIAEETSRDTADDICRTQMSYTLAVRQQMGKVVTLREANQAFARCVRDVEAGEEYVITCNGAPVARLIPVVGRRVLSPAQEVALARTHARMEQGWPLAAGPLNRNELHER